MIQQKLIINNQKNKNNNKLKNKIQLDFENNSSHE